LENIRDPDTRKKRKKKEGKGKGLLIVKEKKTQWQGGDMEKSLSGLQAKSFQAA
jgi:hypothetical protein